MNPPDHPQTSSTVPVPLFPPALKPTFVLIPGDAVSRQTDRAQGTKRKEMGVDQMLKSSHL